MRAKPVVKKRIDPGSLVESNRKKFQAQISDKEITGKVLKSYQRRSSNC